MRATEHQRDALREGVVVERLRTEATNWINAVALQSGRIDRRFRKQHADHVEIQTLEVDLHFFLVAAVRLRRCIEQVSRRIPELSGPLSTRLRSFDMEAPSLLRLRNVSEHIDEYNVDQGRDDTVSRRQVQTWYLDSASSGGPIWGWLGQRLDIEQTEKAALSLYRGFLTDCDRWIGTVRPAVTGTDMSADPLR
ncbi:hypothetical protein [Mycobacteroides abscessus]|uniref:hypothetical protein n=1 Tax=Mycobacteroides abscessus TaxID=36809 RepID=UPI00092A598C|nr:hypothetical protein [Mycobacteroides abscessus]SHQ38508.1 Uncharacterised protein [Mycobacteroides abscessus subsp. abscessus]